MEGSSGQKGKRSAGRSLTAESDRGPAIQPDPLGKRALHAIAVQRISAMPVIRMILLAVVFMAALFGFITLLLGPIAHLIAGSDIQSLRGEALLNALNGIRQTLVASAAGFAAAVGLMFTARTYALSKRAQEIDRFAKAVSLLSSDKQSERIGGLLTIEYVIREKTPESLSAVEVICAFIRERSDISHETYHNIRSAPRDWGHIYVGDRVADDISTALRIIGFNHPLPLRHMLDLGGVDMRGAGLAGSNFSMSRLFNCLMEGTSFVGADLKYSRLDGSVMTGAWLEGTDLRQATLRDVDLRWANLSRAQVDASQLLPAIVDDTTVLDEAVKVRLAELLDAQAKLGVDQ